MYGLLGSDNIWPRYNYLKIWGCKKHQNTEKIAFNVVQMKFTFTFMHLADAFIQSDLQCIKHIHCQYVCSLGIKPTTFCAANAML